MKQNHAARKGTKMTRTTRQAALNVDRFDALPTNTFFCTYAGSIQNGYRLVERYRKVDAETVQASDGRRWKLAETMASGAAVIVVPEGSFSIVPFDARANGQHITR